jgi:hypothetical protein
MYYTPSVYCTVHEQLLGFHGRCSFRAYIQTRYGIKIMILSDDGKSFYMVSETPYTDQVGKSAGESGPAYYVQTLTETNHGTENCKM